MSELVDDRDSKSCGEIRVGSIPTTGTRKKHCESSAFFNEICPSGK